MMIQLWMWVVLLLSLRRISLLRHRAPTTTPLVAPEAQVSPADERWPRRRLKGQQCFPALIRFHLSCFFTWSSSYKCLIGLWDISDCSKWLLYMVKHIYKLFYRYIQQVNHAAIIIQRWYRRHANRKRANENTIKHLLTSKKKVMYFTHGGL